MGIDDGSAGFKRRFAELSRTGNRMITVDHQAELIRIENLKASSRNQASEELLLNISAASAANHHLIEDDEKEEVEEEKPHLKRLSSGVERRSADFLRSRSSPSSHLVSSSGEWNTDDKKDSKKSRDPPSTMAPQSIVDSYDNLDFKVLMRKNIQHQIGSQGFHNISRKIKASVEEEAELSRAAFAAVEQREECLRSLKAEAAEVQRRYEQSEEQSEVVNKEKGLHRLMLLCGELRTATIEAAEAIATWARVAALLVERQKPQMHYMEARDPSKSRREYAVAVAKKGAQLFPPSMPLVESSDRRVNRGLEPAALAVVVEYVGVYSNKDEAIDAFQRAASAIPMEQRYSMYVDDQPKMYIGLRACGNHYLVRSEGVAPDIPCEQCAADRATNPKEYIPRATKEVFPQFLWHGDNYLNKMWSDTKFLEHVDLLKHLKNKFDFENNPLFLSKHRLSYVLEDIVRVNDNRTKKLLGIRSDVDMSALDELKARIEETRNAKAEAKKLMSRPRETSLSGIAYTMAGHLPNLDADYLNPMHTATMERNGWGVYAAELKRTVSRMQALQNGEDSSAATTVSEVTANTAFSGLGGRSAMGFERTDMSRVSAHSLSPNNKLPPLLSHTDKDFASTYGYDSDVSKLQWDGLLSVIERTTDNCSEERVKRAMVILGQSLTISKDYIKSVNATQELEEESSGSLVATKGKNIFARPKSAGHGGTDKGGALMSKTMSAAGLGPKHKKRGKKEKVQVVTQYNFMGATISTTQMRDPVAHRKDNVWCRSDKGEWAGLTTKGRAMKKYESEERFVNEAKRKIEERAELQRLLRAAVKVDYSQCDVEFMNETLKQSAKFKGSALDLDINKAEQYLARRELTISSALRLQRFGRGFLARNKLWIANAAKRAAHEKFLCTEEQAAILCKTLVPTIIAAGLNKQVKSQAHAQFVISANLGGSPMLVSVYACARGLRKSENLCASCRTESFIRRYNPLKHEYYQDRAPCTCVLIQTRENWSVDFYDPISSKRFIRVVPAHEFKSKVEQAIEIAKKLPEDHMRALFGQSFGPITPLMGDLRNLTPTAYCNARLAASKEYSVLGVMPRQYSDHLLTSLRTLHLPPEIANVFERHRLWTTKNPIIVDDINMADFFIPDDAADVVSWEPLRNFIYCRYQGRIIEQVLPMMLEYAELTMRLYLEKKDEVYQHLIGDFERGCMEYEDMRSVLVDTNDRYIMARQTVIEVMKYSKDGLAKFEAEERGEQEDWAQAWEAFEDGGKWYGLNNVSKLRVLLKKRQMEFAARVRATQRVLDRREQLLVEEENCKRLAENDSSVIENYKVYIQAVRKAVIAAREIASEAVSAVTSGMSLHTTMALASSRRVRFPLHSLAYIRDAAKRVQVEYRSGWNLISRKIHVLRAQPGFVTQKPNQKCRCIITVYQDPVTRNYILSVDSDDDFSVSAEESVMHNDFHYGADFFSHLAKFTRPNEIAFTEKEIDLILEKVHVWPENIRRKPDPVVVEVTEDPTEPEEVKVSADPIKRKKSPNKKRASSIRRPASANAPVSPVRARRATERPASTSGIASSSSPATPAASNVVNRVRHSTILNKSDRLKHAYSADHASRPKSATVLPPLTVEVPPVSIVENKPTTPPPLENIESDEPQVAHPISTQVTIIPYNPHRMKYCPPGSYHQRRIDAMKDVALAIKRVTQYLRLNPHSLRPMLGLLHLKRRILCFQDQFRDSLWMRDIGNMFPHSWSNEFCHDKMSVISRRPLIAKMRDSWGDVVVKVRTPFGGKENGAFESQMIVPFHKIVKSLIRTPIMLASLLCETITNRYSLDTIRNILNSIDLELPGEEGRWWRRTFATERTPRAKFVENDDEKYRGVIYSCHRFVSKRYCSVKVYKSCCLDLKIVLGAPTDGLFTIQALNADSDVIIILSADVLKAFLLKKMHSAPTLAAKQSILNLWHPTYFHQLITLILDCVHIGSKVMVKPYQYYNENGEPDDASSVASSLPALLEDDEFKNEEDMADDEEPPQEVMLTWRQKLKVQLYRTMEMFNMWIHHHNYRIKPIDKNMMADVFTALREYEVPPRWHINPEGVVEKTGAEKIFVYDGFWPANDPRRVMRRSFRLEESYDSSSSQMFVLPGEGEEGDVGEGSFATQESVFLEDSYWRVIVSTDEKKTAVEVNLHETSMTDPSLDTGIANLELAMMRKEDTNSRNAATLELEVAMLRDEGMVRYKTPPIPSKYASMIAQSKHKNEEMKIQLRNLQGRVLLAVDAFFDKAALCTYKICIDSLEIEKSDTKGKQFVVDHDLDDSRKGKKLPLSVFVNNRYSIEYRTIDSSFTSENRAQESQVLTVAASRWLQKLEQELIHADCINVPSKLYQANDVTVKAYPGIDPICHRDREVDGNTTAMGVGKLRVTKETEENRSYFRNGISFERVRPARAWEVGPLADLHPNFLERALKGTKPKFMKFGGDLHMVSAPNIGPFDVASVHLFAPLTRQRHVVCFYSNLKLPSIGGMGKNSLKLEIEAKRPSTVIEGQEDGDEDADGAYSDNDEVESEPEDEHEYRPAKTDPVDVALAKLTARRVVWRSLIHGITAAIVKDVESLIDASLIRLEKQVAYECNQWFPQVAYKPPNKLPKKVIERNYETEGEEDEAEEKQMPPSQKERLVLMKKFAPTLLHKNLSSIRRASEGNLDLSKYANVQLYAVYVPTDEDVAPTVFDTSASFEWQSQCYELLGCSLSEPPIRVMTMPGLLYFAPSKAVDYFETGADLDSGLQHNLRVGRFIYEYIANHGWKKGLAFIQHKTILAREREREGFVEAPHCIGNMVMLFRHGAEDMKIFMKWCKDRYDVRQEQLERRKQKEIGDARRRSNNYMAWKKGVYALSNLYWPHFVNYFALEASGYNYNVAAAGDSDIAERMCINLVRSSHLRTLLAAHSSMCTTGRGMDQMKEELRLLDSSYVFSDKSRYMRFMQYKAEDFPKGDWYLSFQWDKSDATKLQPRPIQIIYALYLNHCSVCQWPGASCRIPGCGMIRETCGYCADDPDAFCPSDADMGGSGNHALEVAIKQYLLEYCDFSKYIVPHVINAENTDMVLAESSHGDESTINPPVALSAAQQVIVWREVEESGLNFRYINRRIQHPSVTTYLNPEDVMDAKGGHDHREELEFSYDKTSTLSSYLPMAGGIDLKRADSYSFHDDDSCFRSVEASIRSLVANAGIKIPTSFVRKMLGVSDTQRDSSLPDEFFDPCPPSSNKFPISDLTRINSMSYQMYDWIVRHISIVRGPVSHLSALLDTGTDGAGSVGLGPETMDGILESEMHFEEDLSLQFDRLQEEALTHARDGSQIMVQVLHGTIRQAARSAGMTSGCPDAAKRFIAAGSFRNVVEDGLTIHVYDLSSNVSKVIILDKRLLKSFADMYHVRSTNYPLLAKCLITHSRELIAVRRMDGVCVDVSLVLATVERKSPVLKSTTNLGVTKTHISRRFVAEDKRNMRMMAAAALLSSFSDNDTGNMYI